MSPIVLDRDEKDDKKLAILWTPPVFLKSAPHRFKFFIQQHLLTKVHKKTFLWNKTIETYILSASYKK